jgi:hypothetical protein
VIVLLPARSRCQGGAPGWTYDLDAGEDRRTLVSTGEPRSRWAQRTGFTSGVSVVAIFVRAGRPALPWCSDSRSGDEMIDGVLVPRGLVLAAARSVEVGEVASISAAGLVREPVANIYVTMSWRARRSAAQAAASIASLTGASTSTGASACSPSSRKMWKARRQSLRATASTALLWSVRSRTCRKYW